MNSFAVLLVSALLVAAVSAGWNNNLQRRRNPSGSSSEECGNYNNGPARPNLKKLPVKKPVSSSYMAMLPKNFDARQHWASCVSVGQVQNQGCCAASYAIAPTSVMTDRTCILSNASVTTVYSAYDPLVCCPDCSIYSVDKCQGGEALAVWNYWQSTGIVSGGAFMSGVGCLPYPFETNCLGQTCPKLCIAGYQGTVASDKSNGVSVYSVTPNVLDIQTELYTNGPVETTVHMYLDFATFDGKGVYQHRTGVYLGEHSFKLIGWGTDNGTDYWLAVNSFGTGWGDKGVFKFLRGQNHLDVEANVRAGLPNV